MTQQALIDAFIGWAALHGVVAKPVNDEEWEASPANTQPAVQMTYTAPNLTKLRLPADVMLWECGDSMDAADDGRMALYLVQVLALYGLPTEIRVKWGEFINPALPIPDAIVAGPIGAEIPRAMVEEQARVGGRVDPSRRYFFSNAKHCDGQRVEHEGKRYVGVGTGPLGLSVWLMLVG